MPRKHTDLPQSMALATSSTKNQPTLAEVRKWPATISVPQAASAIGCSKSHLYELIRRGDAPVKTIPLGNRHVVITADLVRLLSGEPSATRSEAAA